jgi:regulator of sirC expression with transglutaminase-like and TPR domain
MERAFVRLLQNRREDAKIDVNNWLATRPPAPRISQEMEQFAIAHTVLGNREKALTFINRALEMEPENYRLVGTRALISFTFDDREQFEKDLNFYLSHCSEDERENVEILLKRLGNV